MCLPAKKIDSLFRGELENRNNNYRQIRSKRYRGKVFQRYMKKAAQRKYAGFHAPLQYDK